MPVFTINTNVPAKDVPTNFKEKATDVIAKSLGKPKAYVAIHLNPGQDISFGGTNEPAALCDLVSIGCLSVDSNKKHSKNIMEFLNQTLKISGSRIYISFKNTPKGDIGFDNTTFDDLL